MYREPIIRSDRDGDRVRQVKFISHRRAKRHAGCLPIPYSDIRTSGLVRLAVLEIDVVRATRALRFRGPRDRTETLQAAE